jgi:coenzyme F420-reducing hydrogenase gamma subunit
MPKYRKLVIGWFSFTCGEDSTIIFLELMNDHFFEWRDKIEFRHCKVLKSKNELRDLDVAFVEGAISTKDEMEKLKEIRKNCKKLVAVGACACTGQPGGQRNSFDPKTRHEIQFILDRFNHLDKVYAVGEVVKVDESIPGCPISPEKLNEAVKKYISEFSK